MEDFNIDNFIKENKLQYEKGKLKELEQDLIQLYKGAIEKTVYDAYTPKKYERTDQLKNSISVKYINNKIYIYTDKTKLYYISNVSNENIYEGISVSENVPYWIEGGHDDSSDVQNMYHHYPARYFLEEAKKMIEEKYPYLEIEKIILDD